MPRANRQDDNDPRTRVCITLNKEVLADAKRHADSQGRSLSNLIEWLLRNLKSGAKR